MSALFDDVSRIVAGSSSRMQAVKLVGGALGGAALALLGVGCSPQGLETVLPSQHPMARDPRCPKVRKCGTNCCTPTQFCCSVNGKRTCCAGPCCGSSCCGSGQTCCGSQCCPQGQVCCGGGTCCPAGTCCGSKCCPTGQHCCTGSGYCCNSGQTCCPGANRTGCCPAGQACCPGANRSGCCSAGQTCCVRNGFFFCCSTMCCGIFPDIYCCPPSKPRCVSSQCVA